MSGERSVDVEKINNNEKARTFASPDFLYSQNISLIYREIRD